MKGNRCIGRWWCWRQRVGTFCCAHHTVTLTITSTTYGADIFVEPDGSQVRLEHEPVVHPPKKMEFS